MSALTERLESLETLCAYFSPKFSADLKETSEKLLFVELAEIKLHLDGIDATIARLRKGGVL